jgi:hypothetical protein
MHKTLAAIAGTVAAAVAFSGAGLAAANASPAAAAAITSGHLPAITVAMNGKKITVGGDLQSGGSLIVSTVTGEQAGEPTFIRLDPGVTLAQLFKLLSGPAGADPNNLDGFGAIVFDAGAGHGTSTAQVSLVPGQYVALDTAGSNPAKWPFVPFVITPTVDPARLPAPKATIAAIEFGFTGPGTLHEGELVRFANHGFVVHMIVAAQAPNAATARKIAQLLRAGNDNAAQRLAIGFATFAGPLSHGAAQQLSVNASPGYWVLACFMNTQDGREHTMLGMERIIRIVR